ncbi:MAG: hypothetical protein ACKOA9_00435 [Actinomycetota bacterium]
MARNEITAFIGPSGCGKTTVLRFSDRSTVVLPQPDGPMNAVISLRATSRSTSVTARTPL